MRSSFLPLILALQLWLRLSLSETTEKPEEEQTNNIHCWSITDHQPQSCDTNTCFRYTQNPTEDNGYKTKETGQCKSQLTSMTTGHCNSEQRQRYPTGSCSLAASPEGAIGAYCCCDDSQFCNRRPNPFDNPKTPKVTEHEITWPASDPMCVSSSGKKTTCDYHGIADIYGERKAEMAQCVLIRQKGRPDVFGCLFDLVQDDPMIRKDLCQDFSGCNWGTYEEKYTCSRIDKIRFTIIQANEAEEAEQQAKMYPNKKPPKVPEQHAAHVACCNEGTCYEFEAQSALNQANSNKLSLEQKGQWRKRHYDDETTNKTKEDDADIEMKKSHATLLGGALVGAGSTNSTLIGDQSGTETNEQYNNGSNPNNLASGAKQLASSGSAIGAGAGTFGKSSVGKEGLVSRKNQTNGEAEEASILNDENGQPNTKVTDLDLTDIGETFGGNVSLAGNAAQTTIEGKQTKRKHGRRVTSDSDLRTKLAAVNKKLKDLAERIMIKEHQVELLNGVSSTSTTTTTTTTETEEPIESKELSESEDEDTTTPAIDQAKINEILKNLQKNQPKNATRPANQEEKEDDGALDKEGGMILFGVAALFGLGFLIAAGVLLYVMYHNAKRDNINNQLKYNYNHNGQNATNYNGSNFFSPY